MPGLSGRHAVRAGLLLVLAAAAAVLALRHGQHTAREAATAAFLKRHWAHPIAAQGEPPRRFSATEASLAPQACGSCHVAQYADWQTSLHSRTVGPGLLWQLRTFDQANGNACLRCHAPLAEQRALTALERGWPNAPAGAPPGYVPPDLHRQGLVCAACHVRQHQRHGPVPQEGRPQPHPDLPHGGYVAEPAFSDSRFCSTCHQFESDGRRVNGKLLQDTYEEWRTSPAAAAGQTCQSCHMPQRRHLWRGIHDPATVAQALRREITVQRLDGERIRVDVALVNAGAGHHLPTYVVPKIQVSVLLQGERPMLNRRLATHRIGRVLDTALSAESADTRLAAGARHAMAIETAAGAGRWQVVLRTEVAPAEHYERMFAEMDARHPEFDDTTRALLRQAGQAAVAARYRLPDTVVEVPARAGDPVRVVAN